MYVHGNLDALFCITSDLLFYFCLFCIDVHMMLVENQGSTNICILLMLIVTCILKFLLILIAYRRMIAWILIMFLIFSWSCWDDWRGGAIYEEEKKKAIDYMTMNQSRVAITTDMWTADHQKKGYMAITAHFIDESWKLRNVIMRYYYVLLYSMCCWSYTVVYDVLLFMMCCWLRSGAV